MLLCWDVVGGVGVDSGSGGLGDVSVVDRSGLVVAVVDGGEGWQ